MYFGPLGKVLAFLRWSRRTKHYLRKVRACQITIVLELESHIVTPSLFELAIDNGTRKLVQFQ